MHRLAVGIADSGKQPAPRQRMTLGFSVTDPRGINRAPASEKYQPLQRRAYPDGDLCGHTNCLCAASNSGGRTKTVPNSCTFWFRYFSGTVGTQRVRSICRCGVRYPINGSNSLGRLHGCPHRLHLHECLLDHFLGGRSDPFSHPSVLRKTDQGNEGPPRRRTKIQNSISQSLSLGDWIMCCRHDSSGHIPFVKGLNPVKRARQVHRPNKSDGAFDWEKPCPKCT